MPVMIDVCTDWQKRLLEVVASWDETEDRNANDREAALIYLFFQGGNLFNPPDCPSFVRLSYKRLIQLKDSLVCFLSTAEDMGFDSPVKEAVDIIDGAILDEAPKSVQRKMERKQWLQFLKNGSVIFLFSWMVIPWEKAICLGLFVPYVVQAVKGFFKSLFLLLEKRNAVKFSRILRRLNLEEINLRLTWAENHLLERGVLERRRYATKENIENLKKKYPNFFEGI